MAVAKFDYQDTSTELGPIPPLTNLILTVGLTPSFYLVG
jgi:hypothetical protein